MPEVDMAKKRALADVVGDPLVKKKKGGSRQSDPADKAENKNGLAIVVGVVLGFVGGLLFNRFIRII
jgi:hypothetical protein